ncbi:MAG: Calx-beta domain-containing protein, partial [Pirellulaceae bacterium]|nr:Calx-beta domain-containing protein [Pirellulaceae bacterium]
NDDPDIYLFVDEPWITEQETPKLLNYKWFYAVLTMPTQKTVTAQVKLGGKATRNVDYCAFPKDLEATIDYCALTTDLEVAIEPGERFASFRIVATPDYTQDSNRLENITLELEQPTNAKLSQSSRYPIRKDITIVDLEPFNPTVFFDVEAQSAREGDVVHVNVSLSRPTEKTVTVPIKLSRHTTAEKSDHDFRNSSCNVVGIEDKVDCRELTFRPHETSKTIKVNINKNKGGKFDFFDTIQLYISNGVDNARRAPGGTPYHKIYILKSFRSITFENNRDPKPKNTLPSVFLIDTSGDPTGDVPELGNGLTLEFDPTVAFDSLETYDGTAGYLVGSSAFFDGNRNGVADFLDRDGDGMQGDSEPSEPVTLSSGDGTLQITIPVEFDLNANGIVDPSEGHMVLIGGTDEATLLPFVGQFTAAPGQYLLSSISTVATKLVGWGFDAVDAQQRVTEAFDLPGGINLQTLKPAEATINGELDGALLYSTSAKLFDTTVQAASLFADAPGGPPINLLVDLAYSDLAEKILVAESSFDPAEASNIESLLLGISFATGIELDSRVIADAATVIAAGNAAIDAVPLTTDLAYLQSIVRIERVAQGNVAPDLRNAGASGSSGTLVADYTGANLDALIVGAMIGNVVPPAIVITDVAQSENDSGQQVFDFTVALANESVFPVSVDYATTDGTATEGEDYQATSGTLNWAAGDNTNRTVQITV